MNKWNPLIALMQMVGGGWGIIQAINVLGSEMPPSVFTQLLIGGVMGLYALHIFAGILLWQQQPLGLRLSTILQALQIPYISLATLSYRLVAPVGVMLFIKSGQTTPIALYPDFDYFFPSGWQFDLWPHGEGFFLGVNLVALVIFWYLRRQQVQLPPQPPLAQPQEVTSEIERNVAL